MIPGMPLQMTTDCGSETVAVYGFANALRYILNPHVLNVRGTELSHAERNLLPIFQTMFSHHTSSFKVSIISPSNVVGCGCVLTGAKMSKSFGKLGPEFTTLRTHNTSKFLFLQAEIYG
jgi:hypothetical protein